MSREDHHETIDRFTELLNAAMKEKCEANGHKKPLAEEEQKDLLVGLEDEYREILLEFYGACRFDWQVRRVLLEFADFCNYGAELLRRLGALKGED